MPAPRKRMGKPPVEYPRNVKVSLYLTTNEGEALASMAATSSASDVLRAGFALLVKDKYPELAKNLRQDLVSS